MSVEDLDGEWWSPKFRYAFRLAVKERCAYATVTNAPRVYRIGQRLLRIEYVNEGGFSGVQMFADGSWVPVMALLSGPDELRMTGGRFSWRMQRVQEAEEAQRAREAREGQDAQEGRDAQEGQEAPGDGDSEAGVLALMPRRRRLGLGFSGRATK